MTLLAGESGGRVGPGGIIGDVRWIAAVIVLAGLSVVASDAGTREAVDAPADARSGCTHRSALWRVNRFADDFGHGRLRRADAEWGNRREFRWYSATAPGTRLNDEAMRRGTLRAYFRERIAQRERLRITRLRSFYEQKRNIRHLNGQAVRRARDLQPTLFRFKGALSCETRKLIVWSMASGDV